ncbi:hypothetical protein ID867_10915 [Streptomyces parvulus]|nr:hypothetical protein [Streptomyces parvulus]
MTVQLDAVQLGDGVLRRADGPRHATKGPEGSDGPVFVDASGRRSRLYRRLGIAVGVACAVYAVVIVSTLLSGNSNAPWLPVDGQQEGKPAGQVDTTPLPSQSVLPSETGGAARGPALRRHRRDHRPGHRRHRARHLRRRPAARHQRRPGPVPVPAGTRPGGDGAATARGPRSPARHRLPPPPTHRSRQVTANPRESRPAPPPSPPRAPTRASTRTPTARATPSSPPDRTAPTPPARPHPCPRRTPSDGIPHPPSRGRAQRP